MIFSRERVTDIEYEIEGLVSDHFEEVSPYPDLVVAPRMGVYRALDDQEVLRVFTVRDQSGNLCGYAVFFVQIHPHFESSKQALCDAIYVMPEHRKSGIGFQLIQFCDMMLQTEKDIDVIFFTSTTRKPIGKLFERLGYEAHDVRYGKKVSRGE